MMFGLFKKSKEVIQEIDQQSFEEMKKTQKVALLDVRTLQEVKKQTISVNQIHLDYFSIGFRQGLEKLDKSLIYVVYCKSGNRSKKACKLMGKAGFENIYNLKGGISNWN